MQPFAQNEADAIEYQNCHIKVPQTSDFRNLNTIDYKYIKKVQHKFSYTAPFETIDQLTDGYLPCFAQLSFNVTVLLKTRGALAVSLSSTK